MVSAGIPDPAMRAKGHGHKDLTLTNSEQRRLHQRHADASSDNETNSPTNGTKVCARGLHYLAVANRTSTFSMRRHEEAYAPEALYRLDQYQSRKIEFLIATSVCVHRPVMIAHDVGGVASTRSFITPSLRAKQSNRLSCLDCFIASRLAMTRRSAIFQVRIFGLRVEIRLG